MDKDADTYEFRLGENDDGRRLDKVLRIVLSDLPLSVIFKALRKKNVLVNGKKVGPDYRCKKGDLVTVRSLGALDTPKSYSGRLHVQSTAKAQPIADLIILRTPDILFLNKPAGVLVHGGNDSMETRVRLYLEPELDSSVSFVPGPLHRLDRNTSGVLAFSSSYAGAREFAAGLRAHKIVKWYLAIVDGILEDNENWQEEVLRDSAERKTHVFSQPVIAASNRAGISNTEIANGELRGTSTAKTLAIPLAHGTGKTLSLFQLQTGRTHQIRAQAAFHGHPLHGDIKYGATRAPLPYYLHAIRMDLSLVNLRQCPKSVVAPLPDYFVAANQKYFGLRFDVLEAKMIESFARFA
ncbi:MAG TPA: RluA family pseudouridine synthase [Spirochaetales bacterium]|nr:RluA family pseudouridine synthase [Spirochaetales bacterium]